MLQTQFRGQKCKSFYIITWQTKCVRHILIGIICYYGWWLWEYVDSVGPKELEGRARTAKFWEAGSTYGPQARPKARSVTNPHPLYSVCTLLRSSPTKYTVKVNKQTTANYKFFILSVYKVLINIPVPSSYYFFCLYI